MKNTFYVTTAIDYANAKPHLGHALEKVQADVIARYNRLASFEVFFLTGTDEHGVKIVRAAQAAKKPPAIFVNKNAKLYKEFAAALDISNNYFIRTTNKKVHWPAVRTVWKKLVENNDIYKKNYNGLYCFGHEAFVTKKDLTRDGNCALHGTPPEVVEEENYFFKLSAYTKDIKRAIKKGEMRIIPRERENEVLKLLDRGLEDVSFSRPRADLKWGIPVPGDTSQTIYVWADALTNYISALGWTGGTSSKFKKFWPADVHVIGKDILRFHAAIWPAMLLSMDLPLPKVLLVHGFISIDGQKMSKTLGNVVDPLEIIKKYGTDALRYYLLAEIPTTKDGDFSYEKFEARYDADLALGLGNFTARITSLGERHLDQPLKSEVSPRTQKELDRRWKAYEKAMDGYRFTEAIKEINGLITFGDRRINSIKLWELTGEDREQFKTEMADLATLLAHIAWMYMPIIPKSAEEVFKRLGVKPNEKKTWYFVMKKGDPLFPRLK